jgi:ankyrin repeat protein
MNSLDNLRKAAKRWLKALRADDADARARLARAYSNAPATPGLRDVQHALARERGYESWTALKAAAGQDDRADHIDAFLNHACPDWRMGGGPYQTMHRHTAERILRRHPDIAYANVYTRVVCGDLEGVQRILSKHPEAASAQGGPKGWPPLLYLCAGRLSLPAVRENAVAIARALLDRGADPNAYFPGGNEKIHYTALTCVVGRGEEAAPPHPDAEALAALLLERGAEPYDGQVFYNISQGHLTDDAVWLLDLIYAHSVRAGRAADWADPEWSMIDMGGYGLGARFVLEHAVHRNHLKLARWALEHGASPNATPARDPRWSKRSLYEDAARRGFKEMGELLVRHGATAGSVRLEGEDAFAAACFRLDRAEARRLVERHPEYLRSFVVIDEAAKLDRADVVALLLDLGMSPDVQNPQHGNLRALHVAAYAGSARVATLLVEREAEIDPVDSMHGSTPLWWAVWGKQQATIAVLSPVSRDLWALTTTGNVERVRELLTAEPGRAKARGSESTPLMWLPDDEARACEIVDLFLAHGADPSTTRKEDRLTAADIARKRGLDEAAEKLEAVATAGATVERFENLAKDLTLAYDTGDAAALQRIGDHYGRAVSWDDVRALGWRVRTVREAGAGPGAFPVPVAKELLAQEAGFSSWTAFASALVTGTPAPGAPYVIDARDKGISPRRALAPKDWDAIIDAMKERRISSLDAGGEMTDAALERISQLDHVTRLGLGGSRQITDEGLRHLARMPQLRDLDLSHYPGGPITDRGLDVLRHLRELRKFQMCWQPGISDAGVANLAACEHLESVDLMGTPTGDGAIRALTGKQNLRRFKSGRLVTDAALPLFHQFPAFKTWRGGEIKYSLMGPEGEPTHLMVDGPFTDEGVASLAGLDGLFALSFFWHLSAVTPAGLAPLTRLPNLGLLGCAGKLCNDEAMRHIAAMPRLRMLMAQGTVASDDGFEALSRSRTIEYIWGRGCPNLTGRGFVALAAMPALHGMAVSCKQVDDAALSTLPRFPALTHLLPMDVHDEGFRHVGRCEQLESLWCMYCRDTTDVATEHISGLSRLKLYYAGATQITDRSLEILGRMPSLERIELYECKGITDAGLPFLARLPNLKEISLSGLPNVTLAGTAVFPARVRVDYGV